MAPKIQLTLFDTFLLTVNGQVQDNFRSSKARALLAYLVLEGRRPLPRLRLTELLWSGYSQTSALSSLRVGLSNLRQVFAPWQMLRATRQIVQLNIAHPEFWCDALALEALAKAGPGQEWPAELDALDKLERIELLPGLEAIDSPPFEAWLREQRAYFRQLGQQLAQQRGDARPGSLFVLDGGWPLSGSKEKLVRSAAEIPAVAERAVAVPDLGICYGRKTELHLLERWLVEDHCRLVAVIGMGGQGKTTLVATLARQLAHGAAASEPFERIFWGSLVNAPPLAELLQHWLSETAELQGRALPDSLDRQLELLLDTLRRRRCLVILDNLEAVMTTAERAGYYRAGYEGYGQLLKQIATSDHRSCLLLTSREEPHDLKQLALGSKVICSLRLGGLMVEAGQSLLNTWGLATTPTELAPLVARYSGNPLALKLVVTTIQELFAGNVPAFLAEETLVFDDIRDVLEQHFARLYDLESELLCWLAIVREPVSFPALCDNLVQAPHYPKMLEAVRSLRRRSLLESYGEQLGLQNVIAEYVTDRLVENICRELDADKMTSWQDDKMTAASFIESYLNRFALVKAQAKEYVRESQVRLLLQPVAESIVNQWGKPIAVQHLQWMMRWLQQARPQAPGYAAANLFHLLFYLEVDLRGLDFSRLALWQADLSRANLPEVNFTQSDLTGSIFMEPLSDVFSLAFTPDSQILVAGTGAGVIKLWRLADRQMLAEVQAHKDAIRSVRLSDDGKTLATGSHAGEVHLWELAGCRRDKESCEELSIVQPIMSSNSHSSE